MERRKFQLISWVIVVTIIITVVVQGYWNWRNYQENKRYFQSEIQRALDNAIEQYYAELAKGQIMRFDKTDWLIDMESNDSLAAANGNNSAKAIVGERLQMVHKKEKLKFIADTSNHEARVLIMQSTSYLDDEDSLEDHTLRYQEMAKKLVASLSANRLNMDHLDSLLRIELQRNQLDINYKMAFLIKELNDPNNKPDAGMEIRANAAYLPPGSHIILSTSNNSLKILYRGLLEIIVSLSTTLIIVMVLVYLYKIIQRQKSLDMMKNDLINNITHEFKTPIATVSTALEAIEKFNAEKDLAKTSKYLKLSNEQLTKLNGMVEKLLDTATLEEGELIINPAPTDLSRFVQEVVYKFENITEKAITLDAENEVLAEIDAFHFEHVISNLIDNAVKYGGDQIKISLKRKEGMTHLIVSDNGTGIERKEQSKIFDKFYRISSGNVHDVKGYGIGLYYARTIIEKHGGQLSLSSSHTNTSFNIILP